MLSYFSKIRLGNSTLVLNKATPLSKSRLPWFLSFPAMKNPYLQILAIAKEEICLEINNICELELIGK